MEELSLFENEKEWFSLEELAKWSGYASAHALQSNPNILEILNQFSNSKDVKIGGYHNTQKFYSKSVLRALKQYQMRNAAPNALKDKETAITGNATMTVNATIDTLLDNPETIQLLLNKSLERTRKLGIENKQLKEIIEEQRPKVEFFDDVAGSSDTIDMKEAAKVLNINGVGRNKLFAILRKRGILDRNNQPYQKYVDSGFFRIIESRWWSGSDVKISLKTVVFQKGLDYIRHIVKKGA